MTWENFYLICFLVGFALSLLALVSGMHIPHLHVPHVHVPHVHVGHGGGEGAPVFNFATLAAFLAWFGGTGYLLTRFSSVWLLLGLGIAIAAGFVGAAIVFLFLAKVLMRNDEDLDPADYEMVGVLGRLSLPIRKGGTGEIVFTQAGTRHSVGARSEDGAEISKGVEVVVTRFEKGIAYVRPWTELAGEEN
jgi:hypothetical protein